MMRKLFPKTGTGKAPSPTSPGVDPNNSIFERLSSFTRTSPVKTPPPVKKKKVAAPVKPASPDAPNLTKSTVARDDTSSSVNDKPSPSRATPIADHGGGDKIQRRISKNLLQYDGAPIIEDENQSDDHLIAGEQKQLENHNQDEYPDDACISSANSSQSLSYSFHDEPEPKLEAVMDKTIIQRVADRLLSRFSNSEEGINQLEAQKATPNSNADERSSQHLVDEEDATDNCYGKLSSHKSEYHALQLPSSASQASDTGSSSSGDGYLYSEGGTFSREMASLEIRSLGSGGGLEELPMTLSGEMPGETRLGDVGQEETASDMSSPKFSLPFVLRQEITLCAATPPITETLTGSSLTPGTCVRFADVELSKHELDMLEADDKGELEGPEISEDAQESTIRLLQTSLLDDSDSTEEAILNGLRLEVSELQTRLNEAHTITENLVAEKIALTENTDLLKAELLAAQESLALASSDNKKLLLNMCALENENSERRDEAEELTRRLEKALKENSEEAFMLTKAKEALEMENERLSKAAIDADERATDLMRRLDNSEEKLGRLKMEMAKSEIVSRQMGELQISIEKIERERNQSVEEKAVMKTELENYAKQHSAVVEQLREHEESFQLLKVQTEEIEEEKMNLEATVMENRKVLEGRELELIEMKREVDEAKKHRRTIEESLKAKLEELKTIMLRENEEQQKCIEELNQSKARLEEALKEKTEEASNVIKAKEELEMENERLSKAVIVANQKATDLMKRPDESKKELDRLTLEMCKTEKMSKEMGELQISIEKIKNERNKALKEIAELESKLEHYAKEHSALIMEHGKVIEGLELELIETRQAVEKEKENKRTVEKSLTAKLEEVEAIMLRDHEGQQKCIEEVNQWKARLEETLRERSEEAIIVIKAKEELEMENELLSKAAIDADQKAADLMKRLYKSEQKLSQLSMEIIKSEIMSPQMGELQISIEKLEDERNQAIEEKVVMKTELENYVNQHSALVKELRQNRDFLESLKSKSEETEEEKVKLQGALQQQEKVAVKLELKLVEKHQELDNQKGYIKKAKESLQEQIKAANITILKEPGQQKCIEDLNQWKERLEQAGSGSVNKTKEDFEIEKERLAKTATTDLLKRLDKLERRLERLNKGMAKAEMKANAEIAEEQISIEKVDNENNNVLEGNSPIGTERGTSFMGTERGSSARGHSSLKSLKSHLNEDAVKREHKKLKSLKLKITDMQQKLEEETENRKRGEEIIKAKIEAMEAIRFTDYIELQKSREDLSRWKKRLEKASREKSEEESNVTKAREDIEMEDNGRRRIT